MFFVLISLFGMVFSVPWAIIIFIVFVGVPPLLLWNKLVYGIWLW